MELTDYQMRNFLAAVADGRVTQYDRTTLMAWADGNTEDVQPLMDWAIDNALIEDGWYPQHSDDSNVVWLSEGGGLLLEQLRTN